MLRKRLLGIVCLCLILSGIMAWADADSISDMPYLTFTVDGIHYTLGASRLSDFAEAGWTWRQESDGTFALTREGLESEFYAVTENQNPERPIQGVNLMWLDGIRTGYLGYTSEDMDFADEFWALLQNRYAATHNEEGHLIALIPVSHGRMVAVETADVRVSLGLLSEPIPDSQIVRCPEQGFSTLTDQSYSVEVYGNTGLSIFPSGRGTFPRVSISRLSDRTFDPKAYLTDTYPEQLRSRYGKDYLGAGAYDLYPMFARNIPGRAYAFVQEGQTLLDMVIFDSDGDGYVRYEAVYPEESGDLALAALGTSVIFYRPEADFYDPQSDDRQGLEAVSCPEQSFSTLVNPDYASVADGKNGLVVYTEHAGYIPNVTVFRSEDRYGDLLELIQEMVTPNLQKQYGEDLLGADIYARYPIGGRDMTVGVYRYRVGDAIVEMVRAYETQDGHTVMYMAKYEEARGEKTRELLDIVARYYQPNAVFDPAHVYASEEENVPIQADVESTTGMEEHDIPEGMAAIPCEEQAFSVLARKEYPWTWDARNGITIYTKHESSIPYVLIFRSEDWIVDVAEYMHEQYTPHMQKEYGERLVRFEEYPDYVLGGRHMPAALYAYTLQGHVVEMLRAWDTRDGHTVVFTAKYLENEGETTLEALRNAVESYQPDAAYYR